MTKKTLALLRLMRPHQWIKNGFVLLPVFFAGKLAESEPLLAAIGGALLFSLCASAIYIFNDLQDIESDRRHPTKRHRALASGAVGIPDAKLLLVALLVVAAVGSVILAGAKVVALLTGYLLLNVAYSLKLKHLAILDVFCVAMGFVLRVFVGTYAAGLDTSRWIILMTFLLAMFLALAKRRDDLVLSQNGQNMRRSLTGYNFKFVDQSMMMMATVTVVAYIMYAVSPEVAARFGTDKLYLTTVFVIIGILRYLQITVVEERSGSPTKILIRDGFLQAVIGGWLASFYFIIYLHS